MGGRCVGSVCVTVKVDPVLGHCPICKKGVLLECTEGVWCSRRYATLKPCAFSAGICRSANEWNGEIARFRAQQGCGV